jgi:dTDP-4-dehydrorhamnose reductase
MMQKKIVLLGANGLLGSRFQYYLSRHKELSVIGLTRSDVDFTDVAALKKILQGHAPDVVVNCFGFLGPDRCEMEPQQSYLINAVAVKNILNILQQFKKLPIFFHYSTDYVFDGLVGGYDEDALVHPISYYGLHKAMADELVLAADYPAYIMRVASVMGAGKGKSDIIKALLARVRDGAQSLNVIDDMHISMCTPQFLTKVMASFMEKKPAFGLYNAVASGQTTWFDMTREAFRILKVDVPFAPIPASTFARPAPRPLKSWLTTDKLAEVIGDVPTWQLVLHEQIEECRGEYLSHLEKKAAA